MEERMGAEGYGCAGRAGQEPGTGNLRKEFLDRGFPGRAAGRLFGTCDPAELIEEFCRNSGAEERSPATIEKYRRDVKALLRFLGETGAVSKERMVSYKEDLLSDTLCPASTPCWRRPTPF